jgi:multicomponent Na+:H+ antiporter subunit F
LTVNFVLIVMGLSVLLALIRLLRGPSLPDRVVALDLIAVLLVGMIGVFAIYQDEAIILRNAIVLALLAFLGTVAFAYFVGKGGKS